MVEEEQKTEEKIVSEKPKPVVEKTAKADVKVVKEDKIELEREYIIPLRRGFLKVPCYRKAKRAVHDIKVFLAKHMKVEGRDIRLVKVDINLNNEIWYRGIKNPLHKIKVKAVKKGGVVYAELADIPDVVKFKIAREQRRASGIKKTKIKHDEKNNHVEEGQVEDKQDSAEKGKATQEAGIKENKAEAKVQKQSSGGVKHEKKTQPVRQVLSR